MSTKEEREAACDAVSKSGDKAMVARTRKRRVTTWQLGKDVEPVSSSSSPRECSDVKQKRGELYVKTCRYILCYSAGTYFYDRELFEF